MQRRGRWRRSSGWIAMMALGACAGGATPNTPTTAFDPNISGPGDTGSGTSSGTGSATTEATAVDDTSGSSESCCVASSLPGCRDPEVEACVCAREPTCCQQWTQACVELAITPCNDPTCSEPPPATTTTGEPPGTDSTGEPPPLVTCDELAGMEGWEFFRCEAGGGTQCNGMGTPSLDCDFCCEFCGQAGDVSCGDLATEQGWGAANCEWNGNGACGGAGTPTCDCNFCCEV